VQTPYDPAKDIEFYQHPPQFPASLLLAPGSFVAYLPGEAHLTKGLVEAPAPARKVVIKIRAALLTP
jgi:beta-galactosidase beta subunit